MISQFTTSDFDFALPEDLIAQAPPEVRGGSRLLIAPSKNGSRPSDEQFSDLGRHLRPKDLLVFNDTKVIPARLFGQKDTGGRIEMLVERVLSENRLLVQMRASHPPKREGETFALHGPADAPDRKSVV